jgi:hypothetical protein
VDDRALAEALAATGFDVQKCIPRFLPYSTKSRLPSRPSLVRLYLKVPLAWRVLGAQAFIVATPTLRSDRLHRSRTPAVRNPLPQRLAL